MTGMWRARMPAGLVEVLYNWRRSLVFSMRMNRSLADRWAVDMKVAMRRRKAVWVLIVVGVYQAAESMVG